MSTPGSEAIRKLPFPMPASVYLKVMHTTGSIRTDYPTIMMSYIGMKADHVPSVAFFASINSVALNFEAEEGSEDTPLEIVAYASQKNELLDFSNGYHLDCVVGTQKTSDFFRRIEELGNFALLINTDEFSFSALVEDSSGEIMESSVEYRRLH